MIEPGHFRLSCFGETILNLELQARLRASRCRKASDRSCRGERLVLLQNLRQVTLQLPMPFAHAIAIESIFDVQVSAYANHLRTVALEIERIGAHILDLGGIGSEIGFLGFSQNMMRLREDALGFAQQSFRKQIFAGVCRTRRSFENQAMSIYRS